MFPIRDHNPSGRTPYVTYALMAVNIVVFLSYGRCSATPARSTQFFYDWAMIPARVTLNGHGMQTMFTSMFLHGGWMHLAGNMLFLWIFGDNIEDEMGHVGYLIFYLACRHRRRAGACHCRPLFSGAHRRRLRRHCRGDGRLSAAVSQRPRSISC